MSEAIITDSEIRIGLDPRNRKNDFFALFRGADGEVLMFDDSGTPKIDGKVGGLFYYNCEVINPFKLWMKDVTLDTPVYSGHLEDWVIQKLLVPVEVKRIDLVESHVQSSRCFWHFSLRHTAEDWIVVKINQRSNLSIVEFAESFQTMPK